MTKLPRYLLIGLLLFFLLGETASAQLRFGLKGGVNTADETTGYHAGVALQCGIPLIGVKIQPELLYTNKDQANYLEVPVHLQWGLDLILLRPYLMVSPYAGINLDNRTENGSSKTPLEYGIGVGGGLDIWRMQVQLLYQWDLNAQINHQHYRGLQISAAFFF